jgi:quinol monooxygenase YgiN
MLIIAGHYFVDPARRDEYVAAFADLVARGRAAPGCLDLAVTADPFDPARVNNYERWESEEALAAFRAVADAPQLDVEMRDVTMAKFHIARETDPFDA